MICSSLPEAVAGSTLRRRQGAHKVRPADDADQHSILDDRHPLDPIRLKQHGDIGKLGRLADRDDVARHDVFDRAAMRFHIVEPCFDANESSHHERRRRGALGSDFGAIEQIAFADDADYPIGTSTTGTPLIPCSESRAADFPHGGFRV